VIIASEGDAPGRRRGPRRLSTAVYLTAVVSLFCLVLIALGVVSTAQVGRAQAHVEGTYQANGEADRNLDDVDQSFLEVLYQVDDLVLSYEQADQEQALQRIAAANARIDVAWRNFAAVPTAGTPADRADFVSGLTAYRAAFTTYLLPVADDLDTNAYTFLAVRRRQADPSSSRVQAALERLHASVKTNAASELRTAQRAYGRSRGLSVTLTLVAVSLALVLLTLVIRSLFALGRSQTVNRTDTLTGLANRLMLAEALPQAADRSAQSGLEVAVLLLDLDGFKQINDTLGHDGGDQVLRHFAETLRQSVRAGDTVVRLGGDEFAMIVEGLAGATEAVVIAERIRAALRPALAILGQQVQIRTSIGIAVHSFPHGSDPAAERELLHQADLAMYTSKRAGTHSWQLYADGGGLEADEQGVELREDLRRAGADGQIEVYYQPIVALPDGDLIGLEALIRWRHPTRGLLSPGLFIPLAEETGLIHDLGLNVLDQACRQVKTWQEQLPFGRSLTVSVNVSPRQLDRAHLGDEILAVLIRTGFNPVNLILEITETALIEDLVALQQLQQLRDNGVRIAIDDFGTGYSSISQLTRLPIDILKIDQSFVAKLNGQPEGSAVAEAVIRLAQALHLDTVAEGVETHSQATELILLGCQRAQGFLYARPAPADET